jgi:hypothetical protein
MHLALGSVAYYQGNYPLSDEHDKQSLDLSEKLGDKRGIARARMALGANALDLGDLSAARDFLEAARIELVLLGSNGDQAALASCLGHLARLAQLEGDFQLATTFHADRSALMAPTDDVRGRTTYLLDQARLVQQAGDSERASRLRKQALDNAEQIQNVSEIADARYEQARYDIGRTTLERLRMLDESLKIFLGLQDYTRAAGALDGLAFCLSSADPMKSVFFYSAATTLREKAGVPLFDAEAVRRDRRIYQLRQKHRIEEFERAWEDGETYAVRLVEGTSASSAS